MLLCLKKMLKILLCQNTCPRCCGSGDSTSYLYSLPQMTYIANLLCLKRGDDTGRLAIPNGTLHLRADA